MSSYTVNKIGTIRQGKEGPILVLDENYKEGLLALEGFGHLQVLYYFDKSDFPEGRNTLQMPSPYKGSPDIMGVFATRSPFRPNLIGLSTVQFFHIDHENGEIYCDYIDADDGTPLLDIKPYTPSMDVVRDPKTPNWCKNWPKDRESGGEFDWESVFNF